MDEASGVDARDGRLAVDQCGEDRKPVTVALDFDSHAWSFPASSRGQLLGFDFDWNSLFEIRDDLCDE